MGEPDRVERAFYGLVPELDEGKELGVVRGEVIVLPGEGAQDRWRVRQAVDELRGGETIALEYEVGF